MLVKRLWRSAAALRRRLHSRLWSRSLPPLTAGERRSILIEDGRRGRLSAVHAAVVEVPAETCAPKDFSVPPTILVLQMAHIGDFILSLRALEKLRDGFPMSRITLVCATWNVEWARQTGLIDNVVAFDFFSRLNRDWRGPTLDMFACFKALPLGEFDIAIDLRHDTDTRRCLYRVKAKARAGYVAPVEEGYPSLDLILPPVELLRLSDDTEHSLHAEFRLELLADAVVVAYARPRPHPALRLAKAGTAPTRSAFAILAVGAGDPIRQWPQAQFVELGRRLIHLHNFDIVVVGGVSEREFAEAVASELPAPRTAVRIDMALDDLTTMVAQAALLVGLGSGVTHLAAALGVATVGVLSGVSPIDVWRPVGPRVVSLVGETPCSPCGLKRVEDCPFGVACLTAISPERVEAAAESLLRPSTATRRTSLAPGLASAGGAGT